MCKKLQKTLNIVLSIDSTFKPVEPNQPKDIMWGVTVMITIFNVKSVREVKSTMILNIE